MSAIKDLHPTPVFCTNRMGEQSSLSFLVFGDLFFSFFLAAEYERFPTNQTIN